MATLSIADTSVSPQLALQITLREEATLENFYPRPSLAELLHALTSPQDELLSYIHGVPAVGKSHLLQGICHAVDGAVYLPLVDLVSLPPADLLRDLESAALLALDDLGVVAGRDDWEEALFHLVNRARDRGCPLWVGAAQPAGALGIALPDLRSRLAGGVTWAVPESSDSEKEAILQFRSRRRGLPISDSVAHYLCSRDSRSLGDMLATLERLDHASLALQRPLTVPLVKTVMGW